MPASSQSSTARRYRIEKYLTEGGMGAIYIGKKLGPGGFAKEVVLKQLLPEYTSRAEFRDLFFREAKISATLDHANIVHTFDLVESDQSLFIVMEYVRGADLRTLIRRARQRKRELSPAAAIHIALEILAGLSYAHARRDSTGKSLDIIHRDVSPSNILCSIEGAAKLSDFGIAKASTYSSVFYRVRGKVGYMSPEQARSQQIDHRCDLFSLSVCLYESLTGERLFVGDLNTPADEVYGIQIPPVSRKRVGLPGALDEVLARALAPQVDDRYQNAADLSEALRTVAHRTGLAFSAPELASHLREILGDDPDRWLREEPAATAPTNPLPLPVPSRDPLPIPLAHSAAAAAELLGKEAASIGIVTDIPESGSRPTGTRPAGSREGASSQGEWSGSVLSPNAVGGSKDFDPDSMLNDEATRPGGEPRSRPASPREPTAKDDARVRAHDSPPPVWTRDSAPFALATPRPLSSKVAEKLPIAPEGAVNVGSPSRVAPGLPGVGSPSSPLPSRRALPRATIRGTAVPPVFQPTGRPTVPPAAPPFPREIAEPRHPKGPPEEIEEATPSPFAIEQIIPPVPSPSVRPTGVANPAGVGAAGAPVGPFRGPPAGNPVQVLDLPIGPPVPTPFDASPSTPPLPMARAPMADAGYARSAHGQDALPDHSHLKVRPQKGGPPGWLAAVLIPVSMAGGAALAHRLTQPQVEAAVAAGIPSADSEAAGRSSAGHAAGPAADPAESPATAHGRDPRAPSRPGEASSAPEARVAEPQNPLDEDRNDDGGGGTNQVVSAGSIRPARASAAARKSHHTLKSSDKTRSKH